MRKIAVFLISIFFSGNALTNPAGGVVASGNVQITQSPTQTQIQQNSQKAIINWQSFNVGAGEKTHFQQPQGGIALNRISATHGPSQIYGQLTATGKIILVNQAGIFFGPGSYVNVGSIIASTANITDENFLAGKFIFNQPSPFNGTVVNKGTIIAAQHGLVAMLGNNVTNEGMIQAQGGNVVLASGKKFMVDLYGDQLINFAVEEGITETGRDENSNALKDAVKNSGTIVADGGKILITAKSASGVVDNVINMNGVMQSRSVNQVNGEIILSTDATDKVLVSGLLDASGLTAGQKGGKVKITGKQIVVKKATIDVSGDAGGGEILLGGDYQGKGPLPNALTTQVSSDVTLLANAGTIGNGGKVIVWGDDATQFYGSISARGGDLGGDGGLVETSGHYLDVEGARIDARAPMGETGMWLLDPTDLTISSSPTSNVTTSGSTFTGNANVIASNLNVSTLTTMLGSANVYVLTTSGGTGGGVGNITVDAPISWSSASNLTLSAYGNIILKSDIAGTNSLATLNLQADNSGRGVGTVCGNGSAAANCAGLGGTGFATMAGGTNKINVYYNPQVFGTPDTIYAGGTAPTKFMLINSLGTSSDSATTASLGAVSNNSSLWSQNFALGKDIDASATSAWDAGNGFSPIGNTGNNFLGKWDGQGHVIDNLYINRPTNDRVGFFGVIGGTASITRLGLSNVNITGGSVVGGLVGEVSLSIGVNQSYVSGSVTGTKTSGANAVGGLIGWVSITGPSIANSYSLADVTSNNDQTVAGLIGWNDGLISNSYSTGLITANGIMSAPISGLANGTGGGSASNSYWDTVTSGVGTSTQGTGKTTTELLTSSTYTGWSLTTTGSSTATPVSQTWFMPATSNGTRPLLMSEWQTSITNPHQLQLVSSTQGASYNLLNNVSFTTSLGNVAEIWGTNRVTASTGSGFYPLTLGAVGSPGVFNGQNYEISNLIIARGGSSDYVGLFRFLEGSGTTVKNVGLLDASITGGSAGTGGIVGLIQSSALLDTVYNKGGSVSATSSGVGGIAGGAFASATIQNVFNTSSVFGSGQIGGVLGTASSSSVINSYNIGNVEGLGSQVGGVVGSATGNTTLSGVFNTGSILAAGASAGGLIGDFNGLGLNLTNSYNLGIVSAVANGGGLIGAVAGPITIAQSYSAASVTAANAGGLFGLLQGSASGSLSNVFWDSTLSGAPALAYGSNSSSVTGIPSGSTTDAMKTQSTYTGFSFPGTWEMILGDGYTYPNLTYENAFGIAFNPVASSTTSSIILASDGEDMSAIIQPQAVNTTAHPDDYIYVLRGQDLLGDNLLIYSTGAFKSNIVLQTDYTNITGLDMAVNTVTTSGTASNSILNTAKGGLTTDILYGVTSNNLTISPGVQLYADGNYTLDGDITTSSGGIITFEGPVTLTSPSELVTDTSSIAFNSTVDLGSFALKFNSTSDANKIVGVTSGTGLVSKIGSGALTLYAANTYSGGTFVTEGSTLEIHDNASLGTGALTLDNGSEFQTASSLTITNALTIGSGGGTISSSSNGFTWSGDVTLDGQLNFATLNDTTFSGTMSGTGSIWKNGVGSKLFLSGDNTYSGGTLASYGFLVANSDTALGSGTLILNGAELRTAVSGTTLANPWQVDSGSSITTFQDLTLSGPGTLNAAFTNNSSTATTTLSGDISGVGSITQMGTGVLVLSGTNTYSGSTGISASILRIGNNSALGSPIGLELASIGTGGVLDLNGFSLTIPTTKTISVIGTGLGSGALINNAGTGTIAASGTGSITLAGASSFGGSGTWTISAPISGPALTKTGSGTLTLSGANTYSGGTIISAGTLSVGTIADSGTSNLGTVGGLTLGGGSLAYTGASSNTTSRSVTLTSNSTIDISNGAGTLVLGGVIGESAGSFGLTKSGLGTLTLSVANTYTGGTNVTAGTLQVNNASSLGTGALTLNGSQFQTGSNLTIGNVLTIGVGGGTISNSSAGMTLNGDITLNGALTFASLNDATLGGTISGTGSINKNSSSTGSRLILSGNNNYSGGTTASAGFLIPNTNTALGTGTLILNGAELRTAVSGTTLANIWQVNSPSSITTFQDLTLSGAGTLNDALTNNSSIATTTLSGILSGTGSITQMGTGALVLSGANTYEGGTTISAATLRAGNNSALGSPTGSNFANISSGGVLDLNGFSLTIPTGTTLTVNGTGLGSGALINSTGTGAIAASGSGSINLATASSLGGAGAWTISAPIVGSALTKIGTGTLTLSGANTFTGTTTINGGTLRLGASGVIVDSNAMVLANTLGVLFDMNGFNETIGSLSGGGGTGGNVTLSGALTAGGDNSSTSFGGVISGGGSLTKAGTGTFTLSNSNSYTGGTTVTGGTLTATNASALGTSGAINVSPGSAVTAVLDLTALSSLTNTSQLTLNSSVSGSTAQLSVNTLALANILGVNGQNNVVSVSGGNTLTLNGVINGTSAGADALTLSGAGRINVSGVVGGLTSLGTITSNVATLGINTSGVTTDGAQTYNSAVILGANATLDAGSGDIDFASTLDGGFDLTLNTSGTTTFDDYVGANSSALNSLTTDAAGSTVINSAVIRTTNNQVYHDTVILGTSPLLDSRAGDITVNGNLQGGGQTLTVGGGSDGDHIFTLNNITSLGSLDVIGHVSVDNTLALLSNAGTNTWTIANNSGTLAMTNVTSGGTFSNIQNVMGGAANDNFIFAAGSSIANVNGGSGGVNTLNYGNYGSAITVNLQTAVANGITGTFSNINQVTGDNTFDGTLFAANVVNTWNITGVNAGTVTNLINGFSHIANLVGSSINADTFNFASGSSVTSIDGGNTSNVNQMTFMDNVIVQLSSLTTGSVKNANNNASIVSFSRSQQATASATTGHLFIPTGKSYTVTYYNAAKTRGEIGDPFYFFNFIISNAPPSPVPSVTIPSNLDNVITGATPSSSTFLGGIIDSPILANNSALNQLYQDIDLVNREAEQLVTFGCFIFQ